MKPPSKPLGAGQSVRDWIAQHPDRFVTRRDMGLLFALFEKARERNHWYHRAWRWLKEPFVAIANPEGPSPPS